MIQPLHVIAHRLHILSFMKARSYIYALLMEVGIGQKKMCALRKNNMVELKAVKKILWSLQGVMTNQFSTNTTLFRATLGIIYNTLSRSFHFNYYDFVRTDNCVINKISRLCNSWASLVLFRKPRLRSVVAIFAAGKRVGRQKMEK